MSSNSINCLPLLLSFFINIYSSIAECSHSTSPNSSCSIGFFSQLPRSSRLKAENNSSFAVCREIVYINHKLVRYPSVNTHLVVLHVRLGLAIVRGHLADRNTWQILHEESVLDEERLLRDARHLAADGPARQRVDHLQLGVPDGPVDAKVRGLGLVARLRRGDQRQARLVQVVRRRQALNGLLDAAADGAVHVLRVQQAAQDDRVQVYGLNNGRQQGTLYTHDVPACDFVRAGHCQQALTLGKGVSTSSSKYI